MALTGGTDWHNRWALTGSTGGWAQVGGTGGHRWVALVGTGGWHWVGTGRWHFWTQVCDTAEWHRWVHCWAQVGALLGTGGQNLRVALLGTDHQGTDHQCPDDRCRSSL
ncbi:unnamed protein product [Staurois parvus]|uniref:Uncharacterized protein n=1 Tax=Staurois parvus TaxID=386267 RepID=A0ABN9FYT8_9NEOB|nr:unnamed protein product [Staurois parvus]